MHSVFEAFTPIIEPIALDEAFLDISGSMGHHASPIELAQKLKARVREVTQLTVSCGIANSKLVAMDGVQVRVVSVDSFLVAGAASLRVVGQHPLFVLSWSTIHWL